MPGSSPYGNHKKVSIFRARDPYRDLKQVFLVVMMDVVLAMLVMMVMLALEMVMEPVMVCG